MAVRTGLTWLRIGNGRRLWRGKWTFDFHKTRGISGLAEQLSNFQENSVAYWISLCCSFRNAIWNMVVLFLNWTQEDASTRRLLRVTMFKTSHKQYTFYLQGNQRVAFDCILLSVAKSFSMTR
jgi:hypothetical protein